MRKVAVKENTSTQIGGSKAVIHCNLQEPFTNFLSLLTEWTLNEHCISAVQRLTLSVLVLCSDSEHIALAIYQASHRVADASDRSRHTGPRQAVISLTFLQDVVGDGTASVVDGWLPGQCDRVLGDVAHVEGALRWAWLV